MPAARAAAGQFLGRPAIGDRSRAGRRRGLPLLSLFLSLSLSFLSFPIHDSSLSQWHRPAGPSPDALPVPVGVSGQPSGPARRRARCQARTQRRSQFGSRTGEGRGPLLRSPPASAAQLRCPPSDAIHSDVPHFQVLSRLPTARRRDRRSQFGSRTALSSALRPPPPLRSSIPHRMPLHSGIPHLQVRWGYRPWLRPGRHASGPEPNPMPAPLLSSLSSLD